MDFPRQRLDEAIARLREYKRAKAPLERRLREEELWWRLRHWELMRGENESPGPASAWLFNNIANKHADAMDSFPEPAVLPREPGDAADAATLSRIIPAIVERCGFEQTYSDQWWYKLKHGTAAYGVFWNTALERGAGDIDIAPIDLLNLFWEPGVRDIQQSRDLFIAHRWDRSQLEKQYPQLEKGVGEVIDVISQASDGLEGKVTVIDWYYKKDGLLHLCKFAGEHVLFASECDARWRDTGWYEHGQYPVVFDTLFPVEGEPVGFGYIAVTKDPQMCIDRLGKNIMECSLMASRPRYFAARAAGINEEEFLDWDRPIVHVEGAISEERVRPIQPYQLNESYLRVQQMKIEELKETASNRDFSAGSVSAGVTAAAAISALQEAGNKVSRDMIRASYRAYGQLGALCLELMRQFYDVGRCFRIAGDGGTDFVTWSNSSLRSARRPCFDIVMTAQKKNPFARVSQNELAKELYTLGFFRPELAAQAMGALELMDFEGKEAVRAYLAKHLEKEEQTDA